MYYRQNARSRHNKYFGYCFIPYHFSSAPQAFCSLKCSLLARKICQMLVLAKINTLLGLSLKVGRGSGTWDSETRGRGDAEARGHI